MTGRDCRCSVVAAATVLASCLSAAGLAEGQAIHGQIHTLHFPVSTLAGDRLALDRRETERQVRYRLSGDVLFDFDEARIRAGAERSLEMLARQIRQRFPGEAIRVEGHTDSTGSDDYNLSLSRRRADAVKTWLVRSGGLPEGRIQTAGLGEGQPVAPNTHPDGSDFPEGRRMNRRVEVIVRR